MSRRTTRRKGDVRQGGPSIYFWILLAAGIVLLGWLFFRMIHQPPGKASAACRVPGARLVA